MSSQRKVLSTLVFLAGTTRSASGFLPLLLSSARHPSPPFPASSHQRVATGFRLFSTSESTESPASMRAGAIKQELESYGISTTAFLEKSELVEALEKARADGLTPKEPPSSTTTDPTNKKKKKKRRGDDTVEEEEEEEQSPVDDGRPREERLAEELAACQAMKAGELKKELEERGISTASMFEKTEFVKALADARVDGVTKKASSSSGYAEYDNVEVITDDSAGPRKPKREAPQSGGAGASPFGGASGGASPFGGMEDMMSGMGGMGGMADMMKNMGMGGGAGGGGANPFGGMGGGGGGMGDAMGKAQEMMKNPKVMEIVMKAQSNPKIMKAMQECMGNPAAFAKYQNDPEIGEVMNELKKCM